MKKQSSVEWLQECLNLHLTHEQQMQFEGLFQQAKQIHKQEIEDAYWDGGEDVQITIRKCEQYYKNTYEKTR